MEVQVGPLPASSVSQAARVLARAFHRDPLIGILLGGDAPRSFRHRLAYPAFFRAAVRELLSLGRVDSASIDGELVGCAAWAGPEPGAPIGSAGQLLRQLDRLLVRALYPRGLRSIDASFDAIAPLHPVDPHWYLAFVGIEPSSQGRGIGRQLLEPVLDAADRASQLCYLETPFPETLSFYRRLGFEVTNTLEGPFNGLGSLWTMLRRPNRAHELSVAARRASSDA